MAEATLDTVSDAASSLWDWIFDDDDDNPVKQVVNQVGPIEKFICAALSDEAAWNLRL